MTKIFSQENITASPDTPFLGAWERADKIIFFDKQEEKTTAADAEKKEILYFSSILKTYYGWFYDRAAEPVFYAEEASRFRCVPTPAAAENISVAIEPVAGVWQAQTNNGAQNSGVYEIILSYDKKTQTRIPVALIDGNLYLDFLYKPAPQSENIIASDAESKLQGFWQGVSAKRGILIAPLENTYNLYSYYFAGDSVYRLRYWQANTDFVSDEVSFVANGEEIYVPKHIFSAGEAYTAATGRRKNIRNVKALSQAVADKLTETAVLDSSGTICGIGEPYMKKSAAQNVGDLMQIVAQANSRRKPDPPPLFPPNDVNWHWEEIYRIEEGNEIIQAVRKRQREFGVLKNGS